MISHNTDDTHQHFDDTDKPELIKFLQLYYFQDLLYLGFSIAINVLFLEFGHDVYVNFASLF